MGKRKRHHSDAGHMSELHDESATGKHHSGEATAATGISRQAGLAYGASRDEIVKATRGRTSEQQQVEPQTEAQNEPREPKKHRKKKSHRHSEEAALATTGVPQTSISVAKDHINRTVEDGLDESLLPTGQSRHQRRRWRRKLIKHDLMPKDQREGSRNAVHQEPHRKLSAREYESTAWLEKPVGQKALARQFATTALMRPPSRQWDDHMVGLPAEGEPETSTPWQRSATEDENVVLPGSSVADEADVKSVKSHPTLTTFRIPNIRTTSAENGRPYHVAQSTKMSDSIRLGLPAAQILSMKRHSFGNKAASVPTYSADGDLADRFRRFSAAAHGKSATAAESSSDESSESSSASDGDRVEGTPAEPPPGFKGLVQSCGNDKGESDNDETGPLTQLDDQAESWIAQRKANGCAQGSGFDGAFIKSNVPIIASHCRSSSQASARDLQSNLPFASLDDPAFDAEQAIDEVFSYEMKMTREMPAGKRGSSIHMGHEDAFLTQESSHCRMTRSASKKKPTLLARHSRDLFAHPINTNIIVQTMRLPDDPNFAENNISGSTGLLLDTNHEPGPMENEKKSGEIARSATSEQDASSGLSELEQSPSPPLTTGPVHSAPASNQAEQVRNDGDANNENDTIVVAAVEDLGGPKKKRKMTGRTSKHFSTPRTKRENSKADLTAPKECNPTGPAEQVSGPGDRTGGKRKRPCVDQDLLTETRALLDLPSPTAEDGPSTRPRKKSRRSKGTDADDDATESEVQSGKADMLEKPRDGGKPVMRPRKRKRPSGGTITDLDASNIIEQRSRHSTSKDNVESEAAKDRSEAASPTAEDDGATRDAETEGADENPRPRKRARPSGGKISDLDVSNIVESRSRRQRDAQEGGHVTTKDESPPAEEETSEHPALKVRAKRKSTGKRSIYFTPTKPALDPNIIDRVDFFNTTGKKGRVPAGVSVAPVPSIHSDRFGIIQEKLWQEPFWLIIAVTFLNKTAGRAAAPVFWKLKEKYSTPEALAEADQAELCEMIWHLGLQTQRSKRLIAIAKAWVEAPPVKGTRWRVLHYPSKGDGKELKAGVPVEEDADEVEGAVEIGRIPGCGPYALDSWRIFCRDVLRGVADDYKGKNSEDEAFVPEWQKVLPLDKELRACLRWMWLRVGWIWDPVTGKKRRATEEEMERAMRGEMEVQDPKEREFAARAAGADIAEVSGEAGEEATAGAEDQEEESERPRTPEMQQAAAAAGSVRKSPRGKNRLETPKAENEMSDNIVVSSPAKKARASPRTKSTRARQEDY